MNTDNMKRPTQLVIIYDGECNFCVSGIQQIQRKDRADQFIYSPRQMPDLHSVYPQLVEIQSNAGMRFINPDGRVYCGADAVYQIYRRLGMYRYITWIYLLPVIRTLLKGAYLIISKNRSRLGSAKCETESCSVE